MVVSGRKHVVFGYFKHKNQYIKDGNILSPLFYEFKVISAHNLNIFDENVLLSIKMSTKSPGQEFKTNMPHAAHLL